MNIALLSIEFCPHAIDIINRLREKNINISLVIIEKAIRNKYSANEKKKDKNIKRFLIRELLQDLKTIRIKGINKIYLKMLIRRYIVSVLMMKPFKRLLNSYASKIPLFKKHSVSNFCQERGIPYVELKRHSSLETKTTFEKYNIDYAILAFSNWLLKKPIVKLEGTRIINGHDSKLPQHKGLDSIYYSILKGNPIGVTLFLVDEGLDTGDILIFSEIQLDGNDDLWSVKVKAEREIIQSYIKVIHGLINNEIKPVQQNKTNGNYNPPMTVEDLFKVDKILRHNGFLKDHRDQR